MVSIKKFKNSTEKSLARRIYLSKKQRNEYTRNKCKRRLTRDRCVGTRSKITRRRICTWESGGKRRRSLCKRRALTRRKKRKEPKY